MSRICAVIVVVIAFGFIGFCQEPTPTGAKEPQKLEIGVWRVPPGLISTADPSDKNGIRKARPGFKSTQNPAAVQYDATEFLKSQGISFPAGSEALYDQSSQCLIVRNTQENLDLSDALFSGCNLGYGSILAVEISTLECEFPSNGNAASSGWPTYADLKRLPDKNVKLLDRVSVVAKPGQRTTIDHVIHPASATGSGSEFSKDAKEAAENSSLFQKGESGTKAEIETVVGPDAISLDTNISYLFRKPGAVNATSEIRFVTSFASWDDYPTVLHVSPIQDQEGKFLVVVGNTRLVNPGGWNLKALHDEAAKATQDLK